jgi:peroxiredoxin (alkyl hydroperoxide reductase subunit C)
MILIGHKAPDFHFNSVNSSNEIKKNQSFESYRNNQPCLLFFYPLDFTFVCPSELIALDHAMHEFKARGIKVLTVSVDSEFVHLAWKKTPPELGGIGSVSFDMAADVSHHICQLYGVEHREAKIALRAAILINAEGMVKAQLVHDLPLGRNIDEIIRVFDALAHVETHGEVCPANWSKGKKAMIPSSEGVASYLKETHC